ncbi:MAG: DUF4230 domain-containing protein [Patescibacteria group bacterium]
MNTYKVLLTLGALFGAALLGSRLSDSEAVSENTTKVTVSPTVIQAMLKKVELQTAIAKNVTTSVSGDRPGYFDWESMKLQVVGDVRAGFHEPQYKVNGDTITIDLGAPYIISVSQNNKLTEVLGNWKGFWASHDMNLETQLRQEGDRRLRAAACKEGILTRAHRNAVSYFETEFQQSPFKHVVIVTQTGTC